MVCVACHRKAQSEVAEYLFPSRMEALLAKAGPLPTKSKKSRWKGKGSVKPRSSKGDPTGQTTDPTLHSLLSTSSLPPSLRVPNEPKSSFRKQTKDVKLNAQLSAIASHKTLTKSLNTSLNAFLNEDSKQTGGIELPPDSLQRTHQITQSEIVSSLSSLSSALPLSLNIDLPNSGGRDVFSDVNC